jgi:hypothetical protein
MRCWLPLAWKSSTPWPYLDDDDIYGPQWLSSHARALAVARWSHPRNVWSLYRPIADSDIEPGQEPSGGRFWAAAAVRCDLLRELGGFAEITRTTFDQEHLKLWQQAGGEPARPDDFAAPQYVYGWERAPRHVSLEMGDRARWYENYAARFNAVSFGVPHDIESRMWIMELALFLHPGKGLSRHGMRGPGPGESGRVETTVFALPDQNEIDPVGAIVSSAAEDFAELNFIDAVLYDL